MLNVLLLGSLFRILKGESGSCFIPVIVFLMNFLRIDAKAARFQSLIKLDLFGHFCKSPKKSVARFPYRFRIQILKVWAWNVTLKTKSNELYVIARLYNWLCCCCTKISNSTKSTYCKKAQMTLKAQIALKALNAQIAPKSQIAPKHKLH